MKRKLLPLMSVLLVAAASLAGGLRDRAAHHTTPAQDTERQELQSDFQDAILTIQSNYAGTPDIEGVGKDAIEEMLRTLDPHSNYFTKSEFDELQSEEHSRFYGIGVSIKKIYNRVFVVATDPGGPAYRAGLRYGDSVLAIDGQDCVQWSSEQVMERVRGEVGESVAVTVERPGIPKPITVSVVRDEIKLPSVRLSFMIGQSDTAYIGLTGGFSSKTDEELTEALAQLKEQGMRQLILDLRNNPGGLLDQAIKVAEKFLPAEKKILEVRSRQDPTPYVYASRENNEPETMPMVILINRRTASASEVVAGALQDHSRAFIVGETSFGKGLVQTIFNLWGGTGLTLTTQRYYTPSGRSIQRDYSNMSFYDYYWNRHDGSANGSDDKKGQPFYTDLGQQVYGGGGITPNELVKSPEVSSTTAKLYDGAFYFVRQLVTGQINGLHEYHIPGMQYKTRLNDADLNKYPVNDKVIAAFRIYLNELPQFSVPEDKFQANTDYIRSTIRKEVITAAYGEEAGEEVFLTGDDFQVKKAIDALPEARLLAKNALGASVSDHQ
ncbi:MAG: S41 family peptidase [Blastocatellia bacterium]